MIEHNDPEDLREGVYANIFAISPSPWDVTMDFGFRSPAQQNEQRIKQQETGQHSLTIGYPVARISMSWSHLKTMLPMMTEMIAAYEHEHGIIPAPGFGPGTGVPNQPPKDES